MIAIMDYGVGNLFSLQSSLGMIGAEAVVTSDPQIIRSAERIILPGVGAFGDARRKLADAGLDRVVCGEAERGKPLMGICLGMQMLFDKSFEYGEHDGLSLIPGEVVPLAGRIPAELKVPHIGWNALEIKRQNHPLMKYTKSGDCVYFVHSFYAAKCEESTVAVSEYGIDVTAVVAKGNVMGCQFHPEKSGKVGLDILKAFCEV